MSGDLDLVRQVARRCLNMHQHRSAVFWADKGMCLSKGMVSDVFLLAEALLNSGQYRRTIVLLTDKEHIREGAYARFLVAQCYLKCKDYTEALGVLENVEFFQHESTKLTSNSFIAFQSRDVRHDRPQESDNFKLADSEYLPHGISAAMLDSSISLLKGNAHEALNNIPLAVFWYREAFRRDAFCYEAIDKLTKLEAFTSEDEKILSHYEYSDLSTDFISAMKTIIIGKNSPAEFPPHLSCLKNNIDVLVTEAENLLSINHYRKCFALTSKVLERDPFNPECLPIHLSVLRMLDKTNDLFMLANQLVQLFPTQAISWFATGLYYLSTRKHDLAKRHLRKSTHQDRRFGPAWLALGHAYAVDNEHDQAIAAYCTAAQIVRHSHIPMLYIGVEYNSSGNHALAERFMLHALERRPADPAILHELGTLALNIHRFNRAIKYLKQAYTSICLLSGQTLSPYWEPLLNNLGHAHRELGHLDEALRMHTEALGLVENSPSTLEAMGLIFAQQGRYDEAIRTFSTALSLQPSIPGGGGASGNSPNGGSAQLTSSIAAELLDICMREHARQLQATVGAGITFDSSRQHGRGINELPPVDFSKPSTLAFLKKTTNNSSADTNAPPSVIADLDVMVAAEPLDSTLEEVSMEME